MDYRLGDIIEGDWGRKGVIYDITDRFYLYSSIKGNWFISKGEARLLSEDEVKEYQKDHTLYYKIYKLLEGWENIKEIRDRRRNESIV
jgi:hypothetical protein